MGSATASVTNAPVAAQALTSAKRARDSVSSASSQQGSELPLWERRVQKRRLAVLAGRTSPEYLAYIQARPRELRRKDEPVTPNAEDPSISKRTWDDEVSAWRMGLRKWELLNVIND